MPKSVSGCRFEVHCTAQVEVDGRAVTAVQKVAHVCCQSQSQSIWAGSSLRTSLRQHCRILSFLTLLLHHHHLDIPHDLFIRQADPLYKYPTTHQVARSHAVIAPYSTLKATRETRLQAASARNVHIPHTHTASIHILHLDRGTHSHGHGSVFSDGPYPQWPEN